MLSSIVMIVVTVLARLVYLIVDLLMVAGQELLGFVPAIAKRMSPLDR